MLIFFGFRTPHQPETIQKEADLLLHLGQLAPSSTVTGMILTSTSSGTTTSAPIDQPTLFVSVASTDGIAVDLIQPIPSSRQAAPIPQSPVSSKAAGTAQV